MEARLFIAHAGPVNSASGSAAGISEQTCRIGICSNTALLHTFPFIMELPLWAWIAFLSFIVLMLALDLGVFRRKSHEVSMKEAVIWCVVWFSLAMVFNFIVYQWQGKEVALQFFTGYLVEICLSVDNVFVFILLFSYFRVPPEHQHRVLFWGIIGAVLMRAIFIAAGIALLTNLHWVIYVFGAFLVYTGIKMALPGHSEADPEKNIAVKLARRMFPITPGYVGGKFFTKIDGRTFATPLFVVLLAIETTDVVFAIDSIPAILGITSNGFIVFTSNIFAILGLRSLYFALAGTMKLFRFLGLGLSIILVFIGVKMLITYWDMHIDIRYSLAVIGSVLGLSILASLAFPAKKEDVPTPPGH
jgi:tellurite resistance protein TerC